MGSKLFVDNNRIKNLNFPKKQKKGQLLLDSALFGGFLLGILCFRGAPTEIDSTPQKVLVIYYAFYAQDGLDGQAYWVRSHRIIHAVAFHGW